MSTYQSRFTPYARRRSQAPMATEPRSIFNPDLTPEEFDAQHAQLAQSMRDAGGIFGAAQRKADAMIAPRTRDNGPMSHFGPAPTVGGTLRGSRPVGGVTRGGVLFGPGTGLSSVDTWAPHGAAGGGHIFAGVPGSNPDNFGHQFDPSPSTTDQPPSTTNNPPPTSPFAPDSRAPGDFSTFDPTRAQRAKAFGVPYADGGMVHGPGTGKSDSIPAKLSNGEFVMDADTVKFFGMDKMRKMQMKAKEGMMEMPDGNDPESTGEDAREPMMMPMMKPMHFADGGFVSPAGGGIVAPWEKDAQMRADAAAAEPFAGFGLRKTDARRLAATPQGAGLLMQSAAAGQARQDKFQMARDAQRFQMARDAMRSNDAAQARADAAAVGVNKMLYDQNMGISKWQMQQAAQAERDKSAGIFHPIMDDTGAPIPGTFINNKSQMATAHTPDDGAPGMMQFPGTEFAVPTRGGKPVPGMGLFEAQTQHAPFADGLTRKTFKPAVKQEPTRAAGNWWYHDTHGPKEFPKGKRPPAESGYKQLEDMDPATGGAPVKFDWKSWSAKK